MYIGSSTTEIVIQVKNLKHQLRKSLIGSFHRDVDSFLPLANLSKSIALGVLKFNVTGLASYFTRPLLRQHLC